MSKEKLEKAKALEKREKGNRTYKRGEADIYNDKLFISELLLKNYTYKAIHEEINAINTYTLSERMVGKIIGKIKEEWREAVLDSSLTMLLKELKKSEILEREAWIQYENSKQEKVTIERRKILISGSGDEGSEEKYKTVEIKEKTEQGRPDPNYLHVIGTQMKYRKDMLGLTLPKKATTKQKYIVSVKKK